nr:MAG TPA: hypothetical protein [Caudoviricetes sp.]
MLGAGCIVSSIVKNNGAAACSEMAMFAGLVKPLDEGLLFD